MPQLDILTFFSQALTIFCCILVFFTILVSVVLPAVYRNKKARLFILNKNESFTFFKIIALYKLTNEIFKNCTNLKIGVQKEQWNFFKDTDFINEVFCCIEEVQEALAEEFFDFFLIPLVDDNPE
jgi:hypothetical protein